MTTSNEQQLTTATATATATATNTDVFYNSYNVITTDLHNIDLAMYSVQSVIDLVTIMQRSEINSKLLGYKYFTTDNYPTIMYDSAKKYQQYNDAAGNMIVKLRIQYVTICNSIYYQQQQLTKMVHNNLIDKSEYKKYTPYYTPLAIINYNHNHLLQQSIDSMQHSIDQYNKIIAYLNLCINLHYLQNYYINLLVNTNNIYELMKLLHESVARAIRDNDALQLKYSAYVYTYKHHSDATTATVAINHLLTVLQSCMEVKHTTHDDLKKIYFNGVLYTLQNVFNSCGIHSINYEEYYNDCSYHYCIDKYSE